MTLPQEQRQEAPVSGGATPGPWTAVEIGQGGPADAQMPIYEIHAGKGPMTVVAEFVDGRNAALIVAAPDMLKALQAAEKVCIACLMPDALTTATVRAAIAKATGKAA